MTNDNLIKKCDEIIQSIGKYLANRNNISNETEFKYFISDYPDDVYDLFDMIASLNLFDRDYQNNFNEQFFNQIENLDINQVGTSITMIFRTEHFNNGYLYRCIQNGVLIRLIDRLKQLLNTQNRKTM